MDHFGLTQSQMDRSGVLTQVVKAAVIRDIAEGIVPDRQNITGRVPFNLMKSEKLVWIMQGVDYLEVVTRRERWGSSHGLSIRVARGVNHQPRRTAKQGSAITPGLVASPKPVLSRNSSAFAPSFPRRWE